MYEIIYTLFLQAGARQCTNGTDKQHNSRPVVTKEETASKFQKFVQTTRSKVGAGGYDRRKQQQQQQRQPKGNNNNADIEHQNYTTFYSDP